jgi:hypothetical protein
VDPSAGVGVWLEAFRIEDAVVFHVIAVDIVTLNNQRPAPQVTYVTLYVFELSVSFSLASKGGHVQS